MNASTSPDHDHDRVRVWAYVLVALVALLTGYVLGLLGGAVLRRLARRLAAAPDQPAFAQSLNHQGLHPADGLSFLSPVPDPTRPDPDALLASIHRSEAKETRGRLKVFFGMAPGVGKTYAMLQAARKAHAEGMDVVVALVETHGREETQRLLEGLPVVPRKLIAYHGTQLGELDLEAVLARRPRLAVVDELAHTNAPGSRHLKRWQDVEELLAAGIDVFTTLNVQHLESRADTVRQITGVAVRETVPDSMIEAADEIQLVDLTPGAAPRAARRGQGLSGRPRRRRRRQFLQGKQPHGAARTRPAPHRRAGRQAAPRTPR